MKQENHLWNRNGVLYFRMRVPASLRRHIQSKEIRCSLRGMDLQTAAKKTKLLESELAKLFRQALNGLVDMAILHPLVRQICNNFLFFDGQSQLRQYRMSFSLQQCNDTEEWVRYWLRNEITQSPIAQMFAFYAAQRGEAVDINDPNNDALILDFYKAFLEVLRIQKERMNGNLRNGYDDATPEGRFSQILSPDDTSPDLLQASEFDIREILSMCTVPKEKKCSPTLVNLQHHSRKSPEKKPSNSSSLPVEVPAQIPPASGITLAEAVRKYIRDRQVKKNWSDKLTTMKTGYLNVLLEHFGAAKDVALISNEDMLDLYENVLKKYPWNRNKLYPGKSLAEIMPLSPRYIDAGTVQNYIGAISTFFRWCQKTGRYMIANPADGFGEGRQERDDEQRLPFTTKELRSIFQEVATMPNRPYFSRKMYPARYWVPLIALFQGMRINEICQLFLDNIFSVNGIPCIEITANEERKQKVKNKYSRRIIPIHSTLLKLGFLDYHDSLWNAKNRQNDQLFPMLTVSDEGYSRKMNSFNDVIHKLVPDEKRKTFHSFRHNFDTALMNLPDTNPFLIACLDGHERTGTLAGRYAKGRIPDMQSMLERLVYDFDIFECLGKTPLDDRTIAAHIARLPTREF